MRPSRPVNRDKGCSPAQWKCDGDGWDECNGWTGLGNRYFDEHATEGILIVWLRVVWAGMFRIFLFERNTT